MAMDHRPVCPLGPVPHDGRLDDRSYLCERHRCEIEEAKLYSVRKPPSLNQCPLGLKLHDGEVDDPFHLCRQHRSEALAFIHHKASRRSPRRGTEMRRT